MGSQVNVDTTINNSAHIVCGDCVEEMKRLPAEDSASFVL